MAGAAEASRKGYLDHQQAGLSHKFSQFGWLPSEEEGGFLGRFFGFSKPAERKVRQRSIVIFVSDGENYPAGYERTISVLEAGRKSFRLSAPSFVRLKLALEGEPLSG